MNRKQRNDWVCAVEACFAGQAQGRLLKFLEGLDRSSPGGEWDVAISGTGGFSSCLWRWFGPSLSAAAAAVFELSAPAGEPPEGFPKLSFVWDIESGKAFNARVYGAGGARRARSRAQGEERLWETRPFRAADYGEPVASALRDFAALCPVKDAAAELGTGRWSLRLAEGLRWPEFLRLEIAGVFAAQGAQSALLMRDLRVRELSFDGERLWAHTAG